MENRWTNVISQLLDEIAKDLKGSDLSRAERNIRMLYEFTKAAEAAKELIG